MSKLPKGWSRTNIESLCDYVQRGKSPKYIDKSEFPVVNQKSIRWDGILEEHLKYIHPEQWRKWNEERFIKVGDILWNSTGTGTIGRACYIDEKEVVKAKVVDSHVTILRSGEGVYPKFLFYWIKGSEVQDSIDQIYTGTTNQVELSKTAIINIGIPLPPLNEQRRIVAKLDELFAHLDTVKARLERIPTLLKQFRQAVLTQAVTGKLTEDHYSNWKTLTIDELATFVGSGVTPKGGKSRYLNVGIPFIRSMNVYPDGLYLENLVYISDELHQTMKRTHIQEKDVLLNITGASIGRATFVPEGFGEANVNQHVCIIRVNERIAPEFLSIYLNSEAGQSYIMSTQSGMTRQGLNYSQIRAMPVELPLIKAQKEIVHRVKSLLDKADLIEQHYQALQEKIDQLPQTILAQAFRGELVPQDPNDEPAEELLQRIQAERSGKSATKKKPEAPPSDNPTSLTPDSRKSSPGSQQSFDFMSSSAPER